MVNHRRRQVLSIASVLLAPLEGRSQASPIRLVVGFSAGGTVDIVARTIATELERVLSRTVFVENRPGDAGRIGLASLGSEDIYLLSATTLLAADSTTKIAQIRELKPVSLVALAGYVLVVNASSSFQSFQTLTSTSTGTRRNVGTLGSRTLSGVCVDRIFPGQPNALNKVEYVGTSALTEDLVKGVLDVACVSINEALPLIRAGRLKAIALTTPYARPSSLPDVPPVGSLGVRRVPTGNWMMLAASRTASDSHVSAMADALKNVIAKSSVFDRLKAISVDPISPQDAAPDTARNFLSQQIEITPQS